MRKRKKGRVREVRERWNPNRSFARLCSSLHFHTGASHDLKQRRRHQGMFFCLLETLTPASLRQIGMACSQMRFLPTAWGEEKKVTHYNYSTWFTELSHLCSPTFPLISFGDLGKVSVCECVCLPDTHRGLISFSLHLWSHKNYNPMLLFLKNTFIAPCICPYLACTVNQRLPLSPRCMLHRVCVSQWWCGAV